MPILFGQMTLRASELLPSEGKVKQTKPVSESLHGCVAPSVEILQATSRLDVVTSQAAEKDDGHDCGGARSEAGREPQRCPLLRHLLRRLSVLLPQHLRRAHRRHLQRTRRRQAAGQIRPRPKPGDGFTTVGPLFLQM